MATQSLYTFTISCVLKTKFTISCKREDRSLRIAFDTKSQPLIHVSAMWGFASNTYLNSVTKEYSTRVFDFLGGVKSYV